MNNAQYWIEKLGMEKHPEGGYYKETYRSDELIDSDSLPSRYKTSRNYSTAIYFLIANNDFSGFHRLQSDEIWHFYDGCGLTLHTINPNGDYSSSKLGRNWDDGETFQIVIKAGNWFAATLNQSESHTLMGCTVAPGFDFEDFELGKKEELLKLYPQHFSLIEKLTKE